MRASHAYMKRVHARLAVQAPALAHGLNRHLGLRGAARRLQAERRACQKRSFLLHKHDLWKQSCSADIVRRCAQAPVLVRGLDRHLGLRDAAKRLEAERRAREERVFMLHPRGPPAPHTVPQPFELATEVREDRLCTLA